MLENRSLRRGIRTVAMLLPLSPLAGCQQPLAVHEPYFRPGHISVAAQNAEAKRVVRYHRALQTARRSCPGDPATATDRPDGPVPASAKGRAALAGVCAGLGAPGTAAQGSISNAYRRWAEDKVRALPKAAETGAGAASDS